MGAERKQAVRRRARRARDTKKTAARARYQATGERAQRKPPGPVMSTIGILIAVVFVVLVDGLLLHNQIEIAQVMATGRSAQATVKAVSCSRGKSDLGDVTVTFTDFHGNMHKVAHTSDSFGCFDRYHVGDVIPIRYEPSDPTMLLTQAEIDSLPWTLILYALPDLLFVVSPPALLIWMLWGKGAPCVRGCWAAWRAAGAH